MKILHIITGLSKGGAETTLYRLITHSQKKIDYCIISLMDEGEYGPLLRAKGIPVFCLGIQSHIKLSQISLLWKTIKQFDPDVIQTWLYHADLLGGLIARFAGYSSIIWGIRSMTPSFKRFSLLNARKIRYICALISYWVPKKMVSCSQKAVPIHRSLGYANQFVVIPNGYSFQEFSRNKKKRDLLRREWGIGDNNLLIGLIARYHPEKDHANFICALAELRTKFPLLQIVLVGQGCDDSNTELMNLITQYQLSSQIRCCGLRKDIAAIMNTLDLNVIASSSESFPNVVAEAMACGTPCVVTDVGDAGFIVGDTGWVVESRNSLALASAIRNALIERQHDQKKWELRQESCIQRIQNHFSLEKMVDSYITLWKEVCQK